MSATFSFVLGAIHFLLWGDESGDLLLWGDEAGHLQTWGDGG